MIQGDYRKFSLPRVHVQLACLFKLEGGTPGRL